MVWFFKEAIPLKDRTALIAMVAKELPWKQSKSGSAVIAFQELKKKRHQDLASACADQTPPLINIKPSVTLKCNAVTVIDPELEQAINKEKGLSTHTATDRAARQNTPPQDDSRPSGEELISRGDQKEGPGRF